MNSPMKNIPLDVQLELQDMYEKVEKLLNVDSKLDPPVEPYRSKYKAQAILNDMKTMITYHMDDLASDDPERPLIHAMLGSVLLTAGTTSLDVEEFSTGEEQLTNCINTLEEFSLHPTCIIFVLNALNQLGVLWSERDNPKKSLQFLEKSEKLYKDFVCNNQAAVKIVSPNDLFATSEKKGDGDEKLEKTHTLTLYYLAQVFGTLGQPLKSALYCHTTLSRQLESKEFDPIDWALNAATLSQFFATHNGFKEARHHLAAAQLILERHKETLDQQEGTEEEKEAKQERLNHRSADVARCWAKYGLNLLQMSHSRLIRLSNDDVPGGETVPNVDDGSLTLKNLAANSSIPAGEFDNLSFPTLELDVFECKVTDKPANVFDEARPIFLNAKEWLDKAKSYYTMENHASDAVEIMQDMSRLYQNLIFFEEDEDRQSKMHKRRIDILEEALGELNPQFYMPICRQLWFELAETYTELFEIKRQKIRNSDEGPTPHALQKINLILTKGIQHLNNFIQSLFVKGTKSLPDVIQDDLVRPVLLAYFYLGKLYREIIVPDKEVQIKNLNSSIDAYQFIVKYCDNHEEAKNLMNAELGICREMLELLPIKLRRMSEA
ncbi:KIF-binding protein [Neocloeon triangulifer]|uniref:KIF-binding protein n=1 Tax=Neocloeon triangulifer TaxID=2078957 RepID=UPI00286F79EB|nr:KIF-binding protein [Neocloeon triangulifer]XP_059477551.1 KIF-binding protein [Neocloeon triangulifer]